MNYSETCKDLIRYLQQAKHLEICTDIGASLGSINWKEGIDTPSRKKAALSCLKRDGLISEADVYHYGIRWTKVSLNAKGLMLAAQLGY